MEKTFELLESRQARTGGPIPVLKVFMPDTMLEALHDVLYSGYLSEGPRVQAFEDKLGEWFGSPNVLALNSGSSALLLALRLAGVRPGDEVISTPMTCLATNEPIVQLGARIRWADIDPATGNIDPQDIGRKINARTRAIMVLHWGGCPCDLDAIHEVAEAQGLKVIEDACQALGSQFAGRPIGTHSDFVCFSFQAVKIMTTVDGGALLCKNPADTERGRMLRWYGLDRRRDNYARRQKQFFAQDVQEVGYKIHMNDLTAAMGLEQLKYVHDNISRHQAHAGRYRAAFEGLRHVRPLRRDGNRLSNDWLYTLRVQDAEDFTRAMRAADIDTSPIQVRNDRYAVFKDFAADLPGVDAFDKEHICIPVGWCITEEDIDHIIDAVQKYDAGC